MNNKAAKWIFWFGTLSSLILFLVLTADSQRKFGVLTNADNLDDQVVSGKKAFERHNCNDCHTILGFGGYYAPDLTKVFTKIGEDSIRRRLKSPEAAFADSYRKMPQQNLTGTEIEDLVAYFQWVSAIDNNDWPPHHSEKRWKRSTQRMLAGAVLSPGAALIKQEDCLECHSLGAQGETRGQRLEWIATHREAGWIAGYLKNPQAYSADIDMPEYSHLSEDQRRQIGEFIVSLKERR